MTKLEEVARLIDPGSWGCFDASMNHLGASLWAEPCNRSLRKAHAVVAALREPTEAMTSAADKVHVLGADLHDFVAYDCAPIVWQAMCDAILAEPDDAA